VGNRAALVGDFRSEHRGRGCGGLERRARDDAGEGSSGASALSTSIAVTLINGARGRRRISAIEAGRYPRVRRGAWDRVAQRVGQETAQTVKIDGEGGDDIREIAAGLRRALAAARWDIREMRLGGTLWGSGTGIQVSHTLSAAPAATALIGALQSEGLPATCAGECTTATLCTSRSGDRDPNHAAVAIRLPSVTNLHSL
jgi:hypothetical protein